MNAARAKQLAEIADSLLHLGTQTRMRLPQLTLDLAWSPGKIRLGVDRCRAPVRPA